MSYDIDAVDPELAPSTGTPVPGGLNMKEALAIATAVHRTGNMVAMDLVEVNPLLRPGEDGIGAEKTVEAACEIVRHAFGVETSATNGTL